jgi:hypothetical protein
MAAADGPVVRPPCAIIAITILVAFIDALESDVLFVVVIHYRNSSSDKLLYGRP